MPGWRNAAIGWCLCGWGRSRRMWARCWTSWKPHLVARMERSEIRGAPAPHSAPLHAGYQRRSAPERLHLRGGAGAQETEVAADRHEAEAALGGEQGALRIGAIESGNLFRLVGGGDDAVKLVLDRRAMRLDLGAVAERDRQIRRPDEQPVDALRCRDGVEIGERRPRLDHREGDGERIGVAQIS